MCGFQGVSLTSLGAPNLVSSEIQKQNKSSQFPQPKKKKKPTLQEKAVGCAHTQDCLLCVKCSPGVSWELCVARCRASLRKGLPFSVHWALSVRRKGHPDRGLSSPVHTACSQVLTDARCEPLRELLPQFIEGDSETAFLAAPN